MISFCNVPFSEERSDALLLDAGLGLEISFSLLDNEGRGDDDVFSFFEITSSIKNIYIFKT